MRTLHLPGIICLLVILYSCNYTKGAYEYEGVVVSSINKKPLDSVFCSLYIDDNLYQEKVTDSTGKFYIGWSGFINKHDGRAVFSKEKYESLTIYSSQQKIMFDDTIFLSLKNQ